MSVPVVKLLPRGTQRVRNGHPWIFRPDVAPPLAPPPAGSEVAVRDDKGRHVASAFWAAAPAPLALRVYARGTEHVDFTPALLADRLARSVARRGGARVARLVHAEADQLPGLFVDRYDDAVVVQSGSAAMDRRLEEIAGLLASSLHARLVVRRDDGSMRDHESLDRVKGVMLGTGSTTVRVPEGATTLELDSLEDAKTGGFLDQRANHVRVAELAHGRALDAFTYHGGFALAAARGAASVVALDVDPRAVERGRRNAELSGITNVSFEAVDAFVALRDLEQAGRTFETVIVDPPALAKRGPLNQALRAYRELNVRALRLTARDGWLVTCSCSGKVTSEAFGEMLEQAGRDAGREAVIVERRGAGHDHPVLLGVPETEYLKCWILRVL